MFGVDPFAPSVSSARNSSSRHGHAGDSSNGRGATSSSATAAGSASAGVRQPDELAIAGNSTNNNNGGAGASSISFAPAVRHDISYRLRAAMDDAGDDANIDNGQDEEDASEQDDLPSDGRERSLNRPVSSNIDDEVLQDPLRNDDNAQVN